MNAILKTLVVNVLALLAAAAQASVGETELPGRPGQEPLTVFYPATAPETVQSRGPFELKLAWGAAPVRGNSRLIVLSHGTGGAAWTYADLARQMVAAGFTVAVPLHVGDNYHDHRNFGMKSFKLRPAEISQAIDRVAADPRFAPLLALDRVGMYGMSAGGHTALTLAGGRWSPAVLRTHCDAHLDDDFNTCSGGFVALHQDWLDGAKKEVARVATHYLLDDSSWYSYTDPRIVAIGAEVPFAADFDAASLAHPRVALGLVRAGHDAWLTPAYHIDVVRRACTSCEMIADVPTAGHGSLMSPQVPDLDGTVGELLRDPPGFDRTQVPAVHARIVAFFQRHLLP